MRKLFSLSILFLLLILIFTACSEKEGGIVSVKNNDEKLADNTFIQLMNVVSLKENWEFANMFTNSVKKEKDLSSNIQDFFDYIHGEVVSFSTAAESGIGVDYKVEKGKRVKEIQSSFSLKTTENEYYIAVKQRVNDDIGGDTGLISVYIINADDWAEEYVYRGDGKWTVGITIENTR